MGWKAVLPKDFSEWACQIPPPADIETLLAAIGAMTLKKAGPWELEIPDVVIRKLSGESPDLYRLTVGSGITSTGVLCGLVDHAIVVGAWGDLKKLIHPTTIRQAQAEIRKVRTQK